SYVKTTTPASPHHEPSKSPLTSFARISSIPADARHFLDFPSPFHAVHEAIQCLKKAGFVEIKERNSWEGEVKPNGKYYFTRNALYIVAVAVGDKYMAGNGISIVGAHIDSPCLKVCGDRERPIVFVPQSNHKKKREGYLQVGCELPMQIAFEVPSINAYNGFINIDINQRCWSRSRLACRRHTPQHPRQDRLPDPTLAIHLDRTANEAFKFNTESQLTQVALTGLPKADVVDTRRQQESPPRVDQDPS
ncbi:aminopeptidase I zinc metalloprotease-domain-containing protein, partial [Jimgerdemannia flammicorona]